MTLHVSPVSRFWGPSQTPCTILVSSKSFVHWRDSRFPSTSTESDSLTLNSRPLSPVPRCMPLLRTGAGNTTHQTLLVPPSPLSAPVSVPVHLLCPDDPPCTTATHILPRVPRSSVVQGSADRVPLPGSSPKRPPGMSWKGWVVLSGDPGSWVFVVFRRGVKGHKGWG